ncbi:MAG: pyruvate kinase [Bacteriovoracaceae bacterium]|nr:pyruvate kinase [Bacteriovoracaceae bacterium]
MAICGKRKAKIVCTLGPASSDTETICSLIRAGLNVARVNMSHGTHEGHAQTIANIREASKITGREVAILLDLQGPKIRVDKLPQQLELKDGDTWYIGSSAVQDKYPQYQSCFIPTIYEKLVADCEVAQRVLFDDGLIIGEIIEKEREVIKIKIATGGMLKSNKGINLPDTDVSAPSFTDKDRKDLTFGLTQDLDYVALSFVRSAQDIELVKEFMKERGGELPIISKIEKPQAIDNIDEIIEVTDAIMIARGDMGVEVGNHIVPIIQKKIIRKCNHLGVPVITATQMLESMVGHPTPTRAEASDVANAIWDGTGAVMLSAETASGKYPIEAVETMSDIILETEKTPRERPLLRDLDLSTISASIMVSASSIAEKINAKKILVITQTGKACLEMMRFRPRTLTLGVTCSLHLARKMCLYWGIRPFLVDNFEEDNTSIEAGVIAKVKEECGLEIGERIVIARGSGKSFKRGSSNSVRVKFVE